MYNLLTNNKMTQEEEKEEKEKKKRVFNLILQGYVGILWLQESQKTENEQKSIGNLLKDFKTRHENIEPLNLGVLIMTAYLGFVYLKGSKIKSKNLSKINLLKFHIQERKGQWKGESDNAYLLRRLRNSLAHANFEIKNDMYNCKNQMYTTKKPNVQKRQD